MGPQRIVVLLSGRGSNLAALLEAAGRERWRDELDAQIVGVISNVPAAPGLLVAAAAQVPTAIVDHCAFAGRESFEGALELELKRFGATLIVLAGFMRVLTPAFVARYVGRLVNIHPSLLPAFPGLHTHRRALAAGVRVHGATVHFVTPEVDGGAIIAQAALAVEPDDDEAALGQRVLALEHQLLPSALRLILQRRVRFDGTRLELNNAGRDELALLAR